MKSYHVLFVTKKKAEVDILITGASSNICDACVNKANLIVEQEKVTKSKSSNNNLFKNLKPIEIHKYLDKYIIGQELTKKSYLLPSIITTKELIMNMKGLNWINQIF